MIESLKSVVGLSDVTISSCNGFKANLHKIVLASSSTYFQRIFQDFKESKHPIVVLAGEILVLLVLPVLSVLLVLHVLHVLLVLLVWFILLVFV